jgi:hypothetical protein
MTTARRLSRPKNVYGPQGRLPVGRTKFYEDYVNTGRLRLVRLGPKSVAVVDDEVDKLITELIAERDARHEGNAGSNLVERRKTPTRIQPASPSPPMTRSYASHDR